MELFELYLSPINATRFKAIVTQSLGGECESESELPFIEGEKDWRLTLIKALESTRFRPENFCAEGEQEWMVKEVILASDRSTFHPDYQANIGRALYRSLFPPNSKVEKALQKSISLAEEKHTQLLIRLKFEADVVQRSRLTDYPWELLHDGQRFLCHHQVGLARYIAHDTASPSFPPVEQVNVLLVSSAACDPELGLKQLSTQERQAIRDGLEKASVAGHIRVSELSSPTFKKLRAYLTEPQGNEAPQVLHFDGHGLFGKRCSNQWCRAMHKGIKRERCRVCDAILPDPQGYLVFEDEYGRPDYISGSELGTLLHQLSLSDSSSLNRGISLCVLSACQSGMAVAGESAFNGAAQNLVNHRVPAVVAMQYSVSVESASNFAEQFYRSLGQKNSLAVAVSQGREAMGTENNQWYRPVLYLRWRDNEGGQLFRADFKEELGQELPVSQTRTSRFPKWLNSRLSIAVLTGTGVTAVVLLVRVLGCLQSMELSIYDHLLRISSTDSPDKRLTIIEVTKSDLDAQRSKGELSLGGSKISSRSLEDILQILSQGNFKPSIIVLDLYRDFGKHEPLKEIFQKIKKDPSLDLYVACEFSYKENGEEKGNVPPPLENVISHEHVGFSNFNFDEDQVIRRQLIEMNSDGERSCRTRYSLSFLVAKRYLEKINKQQVERREIKSDDDNFILNGTQLKRISTWAFGGYQDSDARGVQFMLKYNAPDKDLRKVTKALLNLEYVRNNKEKLIPEDFKNRIVLIGITGEEANDSVKTPYGETYGVFVHAQMISQLISTILDNQPLIWVLPQWGEAGLVLVWGITGGLLGAYIKSRRISLLIIGVGAVIIYVTAAVIMIFGAGWIPTLPPILVLVFSEEIARYLHQRITLSLKTSG